MAPIREHADDSLHESLARATLEEEGHQRIHINWIEAELSGDFGFVSEEVLLGIPDRPGLWATRLSVQFLERLDN